jgi:hypothetical protein
MTEPSGAFRYHVLVSHSAQDREFAAGLAEDLVQAGFRVWFDAWNFGVGETLAEAIDEALRASQFLFTVMSPDYFRSRWTAVEWKSTLAEELESGKVRMVPILYRDCDIPEILRSKTNIDFRDKDQYAVHLAFLVKKLQDLIEVRPSVLGEKQELKLGEHVKLPDTKMLSDLRESQREVMEAFRSKPGSLIAPTPTDVDKSKCFIVMPFSVKSLNVVYEDFVKPVLVHRCKLRPERGDDVFGSNVIMEDITKSIRRARLIIADLTGRNPNVFYEVGIAHALNKNVLLMTQSIDDVPFDLRHRRALVHEYSPHGCKKLEGDLYANVQKMLTDNRDAAREPAAETASHDPAAANVMQRGRQL